MPGNSSRSTPWLTAPEENGLEDFEVYEVYEWDPAEILGGVLAAAAESFLIHRIAPWRLLSLRSP